METKKQLKEQVLEKIEILRRNVRLLLRVPEEEQTIGVYINLSLLDATTEELRNADSQTLICKNLSFEYKDWIQEDHFVELVEYKNLIDPSIIAWTPLQQTCQVFGVSLQVLCQLIEVDDLVTIMGTHYCNWNKVKNLFGNTE